MSVEGISHPQTTTVVLDPLEVGLGQGQGGRGSGRGRPLTFLNVPPRPSPPFVVRGLSLPLNPHITGEVSRRGDNSTLQSAASSPRQHFTIGTVSTTLSGQIRYRAATSGLDSGESGPSRSLPRMSVEGTSHPQTTTVVLDPLEVRLGQGQGGRGRGGGRDRGRGRG
jgi:hypothetical protein